MPAMIAMFLLHAVLVALQVADGQILLRPSESSVGRDVGTSYVVSCHAKEGLLTKWKDPKGNQIMLEGRIHVEQKENEGTNFLLVFDNIKKSDQGNYTCSSMIGNQEMQRNFFLHVVEPIKFLNTKDVVSADEGSTAKISCSVSGDPKPSIHWSHNNTSIPSEGNDKYKILPDQSLSITKVSLADRGQVQCKAIQTSPIAVNMLTKPITLKVNHKPMWKDIKDQVYGYLGGVVNLTCTAEAEPEPRFEWVMKDSKIKPDALHKFYNFSEGHVHTSVLQITLKKNMFGGYVCKAINTKGQEARVITLEEGYKPLPPTNIELDDATDNSVRLEITAESVTQDNKVPLPIVGYKIMYKAEETTWENSQFQELTEKPYILKNLSQNTVYIMRVATLNAAGPSDYTDEIKFKTLPIVSDSVNSNSVVTWSCQLITVAVMLGGNL